MRLRLYEYQMKFLLRQAAIPVPEGEVVTTPDDAYRVAVDLGGEVVLKAQTLTSERLPGITMKIAHTPAGARDVARRMLAEKLGNRPIRQILIETKIHIQQAMYLAIITDYAVGRPLLMTSLEGGKDPNQMKWDNSDIFSREYINPVTGLHGYQANKIASDLDFPHSQWRSFVEIIGNVYQCYVRNDAEKIEINPLVITTEGYLMALDGRMYVDPHALYRQPQLAAMYDSSHETALQTQARHYGIHYVALEGQIGCLVNGAGLALTIQDMLHLYSPNTAVQPACIVDAGSSALPEEIHAGLKIILSHPSVKVVLVNIFDGYVEADLLANAILRAWHEVIPTIPVVIRLQGSGAAAAHLILLGANIPNLIVEDTLSGAVQRAIEMVTRSHAL
jgi:succinyl-CoA synthetase beta subunit